MARVGVTKDEVFQAADHLRQEGKPVTVLSVRNLLGRGSSSTINPFVQEWKNLNQPQVVQDKEDLPEMPEVLKRSLNYNLQNLWKEALTEAGKIYQQKLNELEAINEELKQKLKQERAARKSRRGKEKDELSIRPMERKARQLSQKFRGKK
jgi:hypothetical protein